jgi:hypothetical protein
MPTVVPFPRKSRASSLPPVSADQISLARLMMDLNATYDTVADVVKNDPLRRVQLRTMTESFMSDIARIGAATNGRQP